MYVPPFDPVHAEKVRMFKGVPRYIRKARYPELFQLKYGEELIQGSLRNNPPPPQFEAWLDDVLRESGDARDKFIVALHPFTKRWCLWEKVQNPVGGPGYYLTSMFQEAVGEDGKDPLPADLVPSIHSHLQGRIGAYRHPTKKDFELVRYYADRRLGKYVLDERLEEPEVQRQREADSDFEAFNHDLHMEMFNAVHDVANGAELRIRNGEIYVYGSKQRSFPDESELHQPRENPERWASHKLKHGGRVRVRLGSRLDLDYTNDSLERERHQETEAAAWAEQKRKERAERYQRLGIRQKTM